MLKFLVVVIAVAAPVTYVVVASAERTFLEKDIHQYTAGYEAAKRYYTSDQEVYNQAMKLARKKGWM